MGLINWQAIKEKRSFYLGLDITMLFIALIHLFLLAFDTSYFAFRTLYFHHVPSVVASYDPLKGVEPHRFTSEYLGKSKAYFAACRQTGEVSPSLRLELTQLSYQMIKENPFERANQTGALESIKFNIREFTQTPDSSKTAFETFWNQDCQLLKTRAHFFETDIAYYMRTNYWRRMDRNGRLIDHFFYIDLGFIVIFLLEFLIMWGSAMRRFGKDQRILYPLYHWYDILSCIPLREFRILRLLRVLAVYYRLIKSDIISVKDNPIYRRIMSIKDIIEEEISDQVALNILSNIQDKTRLGTNRKLLEEIVSVYQEPIKHHLIQAIKTIELPSLIEKESEWVQCISELTYDSICMTEDYQRLSKVPLVGATLPHIISQDIIESMVDQAFRSFRTVLDDALDAPEMNALLNSLIQDILDQSVEISRNENLQGLLEDINIQVIEELKKSSTAKIWKMEKKGETTP